jgi:hypothetical protein
MNIDIQVHIHADCQYGGRELARQVHMVMLRVFQVRELFCVLKKNSPVLSVFLLDF